MLFAALPFAQLPVLSGYAVWILVTAAMFWFAMRTGGLKIPVALAALLSPAMLENIAAGQNGAWTSCFLVAGLLLCDSKPWIAGVLLGFLVTKPHIGLLLPVCMLATGNWRTTAGAGLSAAVLVLAAGLAFGWDSWSMYFHERGALHDPSCPRGASRLR